MASRLLPSLGVRQHDIAHLVGREHHIEQRDATRNRDGRIFYRRNLLATLREREVARAGAEMAEGKALPFRAAKDGESVSGKFTGTVQLTSGKFAIVEKSHEFTLVPSRGRGYHAGRFGVVAVRAAAGLGL